ncbi:hypothetical protein OG244_19545 [Streptomyces brevispora]|uniref:hypothetical protein n=1 Tax=Streptomyces brevispora TaxID=887462 RepID=UPI002E2F1A39|nr:hypothetical protein [Streptomyces brevispora]
MDNTCDICHHHAPAGCYLCDGCAYRMHTWLREIPRHLPLLQDLLRPDTGPAQRGGSGRAHSPLPVRLDVLDLLGPGHVVALPDPLGDQSAGVPLAPLLYGWARYLAADLPSVRRDEHGTIRIEPCTGPVARHGSSITAWCSWLDAYLPYAVTRPWVADMHEQLENALQRIRRITHTKPRRRLMDAPCPASDCQAFALVEKDDELHISCEACGHRLTPDEYAAHRAQVMPVLAAIALHLGTHQAAAA